MVADKVNQWIVGSLDSIGVPLPVHSKAFEQVVSINNNQIRKGDEIDVCLNCVRMGRKHEAEEASLWLSNQFHVSVGACGVREDGFYSRHNHEEGTGA